MFRSISSRKSAVDLCEDELKKSILSGRFRAGDKLPPEREMSEMFGLNRLTIRTALARVAAQGLLSVRQGQGYTVEDYRRSGGPQLIAGLIEMNAIPAHRMDMIEDLLRIRRHLARALLEKIAEMPVVSTAGVDAAIEHFASVVERGGSVDELAEADLSVLGALVEVIDSPIYGLCLHPIQKVLAELPQLRKVIYRDPDASVTGYRVLQFVLKQAGEDIIEPVLQELTRRDEATMRRLSQLIEQDTLQ